LAFGPEVVYECVPVSTLKKFATGSGAADKKMMQTALFRMHPEFKTANLDENAIDAIWILQWAKTNLARILPLPPQSAA
jgi:hypothetical protein